MAKTIFYVILRAQQPVIRRLITKENSSIKLCRSRETKKLSQSDITLLYNFHFSVTADISRQRSVSQNLGLQKNCKLLVKNLLESG